MVFVTTDPARDDVATLRSYLDRFDPSFDGLTGDLAADRRARQGVRRGDREGQEARLRRATTSRTAPRSSALLPDHRAPFVWTQGTDPSTLADDITTILDDKVPGL